MEIHNQGKDLRVHFQINKSSQPAGSVENGRAVDRTNEAKPQRLLERLEGDAKVRERLLVEIQAKVQAGEYMTRAAAEDAAQHLVE